MGLDESMIALKNQKDGPSALTVSNMIRKSLYKKQFLKDSDVFDNSIDYHRVVFNLVMDSLQYHQA